MPKELTHILIAQEVLERFKELGHKALAQALENNLHAFYMGAIVPDALFYNVLARGNVSRDYARLLSALHAPKASRNDEKAVSFFSAIGAAPFGWPLKVAFSAGCVTHTVSDRIIHDVIGYYTNRWGQKGAVATATHRHFETLIDMVLLKRWDQPVKSFDLKAIAQALGRQKDSMLAFYLAHMLAGEAPFSPRLFHVLKRAFAQQLLFVKLFKMNRLYCIVNRLNNLMAGRLEKWTSLFYPKTVGPETFPILRRLDVDTLTDGKTFSGSIPALVQKIITEAVSLICDGLDAL